MDRSQTPIGYYEHLEEDLKIGFIIKPTDDRNILRNLNYYRRNTNNQCAWIFTLPESMKSTTLYPIPVIPLVPLVPKKTKNLSRPLAISCSTAKKLRQRLCYLAIKTQDRQKTTLDEDLSNKVASLLRSVRLTPPTDAKDAV